MKILGICGSLRQESYNLKLLKNCISLLEESQHLEIALLHEIPLYNEDVEKMGFPNSVKELGQKIANADALLFACPEYNYSVPGVLKNTIDWVSRLPEKPFLGKKAAIIGASPGRLGSARAQYHLRQIGVFVDLRFLNRPEIMLGEAHTKFNEQGLLIDAGAQGLLKKLLATLGNQ